MPDEIMKTIQEIRCALWHSAEDNENLQLNYDLGENSIVFDLGGYEGEWSNKIFSKYRCSVHIFEPVTEFADKIEKRFAHNDKITLHRFGLSSENKKAKLFIAADGSSVFKPGHNWEDITLVKAIDFLRENNIDKIDLMKINIEGGEYELLEHLIDTNLIHNIINLQIQFHDFVAESDDRMRKIQLALQTTHHITYQYEYIWENWKKKELPKSQEESEYLVSKLYTYIHSKSDELYNCRREIVLSQGLFQDKEKELKRTLSELESIQNHALYKSAKYLQQVWLSVKSIYNKLKIQL